MGARGRRARVEVEGREVGRNNRSSLRQIWDSEMVLMRPAWMQEGIEVEHWGAVKKAECMWKGAGAPEMGSHTQNPFSFGRKGGGSWVPKERVEVGSAALSVVLIATLSPGLP